MFPSIVAAIAVASTAACPVPAFVPHDGALRFSATDLEGRSDAPSLRRAFTTSLPFQGQFGVGFGIEEELRVEPLPGGALRVTVPGPCPACAAAIPDASPEALSDGVAAAAATLVASGASTLADEALAYARALAADPAYRRAQWTARREAWLRAAREEPADRLERLPVAARFRVVALPSGYLRFADASQVQELDRAGRLLRTLSAAGVVREIQRDAAGRIVRITDRRERALTFELDADGRVVRATSSDGASVRYGYEGGRLAWTEAGDERVTYGWDDAGRVVRLTCGDRAIAASYEAPGDGGRVTSLDDPQGRRERYVYEGGAAGMFRAVTVYALPLVDAPDVLEAPEADEPHELRRYSYVEPMTEDGRRWTWQAIEEQDGLAEVTVYDDRTFQPLSFAQGDRVARFERDGFGRILRKEVGDEAVELTWAPQGKVASVTRRTASDPDAPPTVAIRYGYDARAQLVSAEGLDASARASYDARGRMETLVTTSGGTERRLTFGYGEGDRPVRIEAEGLGAITVEYDARGEIRKVDSPDRRVALGVTSAFHVLLDLVRPADVKVDVW